MAVSAGRAEEARAAMLELFPAGFEEVDGPGGLELVAYTDADGEAQARGVERSRAASDVADGARLWRRSEELTGITYPWP